MYGDCVIGSMIPLPNVTWLFDNLNQFHQMYGNAHPYLAMCLCIVGTLMNIVTVAVLTRRSMISPVNVLLCSVAICDICVMATYLIFVMHFLIIASDRCQLSDYSYTWALFTLIHAHTSVIFHATSIWLTVLLALIRVLTISRATSAPSEMITARFTAALSIATTIIMICINIPNYLTFYIISMPASYMLGSRCDSLLANDNQTTIDDDDDSVVVWNVQAMNDDCRLITITFWSNGLLFKVLPCFLLTISIGALLKLLSDVSNRRRSLATIMKKKKMPSDHTTLMLVTVLSIFLVSELPQGIMLVMTGIYSSDTFRQKIYSALGDFMDLLSLINSSINFLIYCAMSRKFRHIFLQMFARRCYRINSDDDDENVDLRPNNTAVGGVNMNKRRQNQLNTQQATTTRSDYALLATSTTPIASQWPSSTAGYCPTADHNIASSNSEYIHNGSVNTNNDNNHLVLPYYRKIVQLKNDRSNIKCDHHRRRSLLETVLNVSNDLLITSNDPMSTDYRLTLLRLESTKCDIYC